VIQRKTQTENYWQEEFDITDQDTTGVYDLVLEEGEPVPMEALVVWLMERHCRLEEAAIQTELSKGPAYQPAEEYEVGQQLIFPAFEYALGTVVGEREAISPEYGEFTAIQVQFEGEDQTREFASGLGGDHKLNRADGEVGLLASKDLLPGEQLYELYGSGVEAKLGASLGQHEEFVQFGTNWFLRELLVDVHLGQLNIAEALIEIKSRPLPTDELLQDLDLPQEVTEEIRVLSLNRALEADERFDNVGDSGRTVWYLRRLTPDPVVNPPAQLAYRAEPYSRDGTAAELLTLEATIDDEHSAEDASGPSRPVYRANVDLIYPHWRHGTLPLTARTRGLFPKATTHHTPVVLVEGQGGEKMQGWVVHEASFVYGLRDWYDRHKLPVGATINLARTRDPRVVMVDYQSQRLQRLWVKAAVAEEGRLSFHMRKVPIACEFDEHIILAEDDREALDDLWAAAASGGETLLQIMIRVLPELVTLSPQGTVHAKTVYGAVNLLKRTPPGPVFALLSTESCFIAMGGGYWAFDEALV
jgi:hypothetical protein